MGLKDFKKELLLQFDLEGIEAAVDRKFLAEAQPICEQVPLFRNISCIKHLHPDDNDNEILPHITEALIDKLKQLVKVA